jgi:hypothetical protein
MDRDAALRNQIRQALDPGFEPAPWLAHRVIASVRAAHEAHRHAEGKIHMETIATAARRPASRTVVLLSATVAFAIVAVLVLATKLAQPSVAPVTAGSPTTNYLSAVHEGWQPWWRTDNTAWLHCANTAAGLPQASLCRADTLQLKADTQHFLDLLNGVSVPSQLRDRDQVLRQSLQDMQPLLDQRIAALDSGNLTVLDQANHAISKQEVRGVHLAEMSIDCWPRAAQVIASGDGGSLRCVY